MKATNRKGWRLILEMAISGALVCSFFCFLLFYTSLGNKFPDLAKLWIPIISWVITMAFLIAHRTPDGYVEFKLWRKD